MFEGEEKISNFQSVDVRCTKKSILSWIQRPQQKKKVAITWIFEGREQIKLDSLIAEYVHELEMAASAVINSKSDDQQFFIPIEMTCSEDLVEFRRFCN